jgi:hypothetical protein
VFAAVRVALAADAINAGVKDPGLVPLTAERVAQAHHAIPAHHLLDVRFAQPALQLAGLQFEIDDDLDRVMRHGNLHFITPELLIDRFRPGELAIAEIVEQPGGLVDEPGDQLVVLDVRDQEPVFDGLELGQHESLGWPGLCIWSGNP